MHVRTIGWSATAPGAAGAAAAALTGDSLTVENNQGNKNPLIVALWNMQQAVGFQRILLQNSGHDTTRNFQCGARIADTSFRLPRSTGMPVVAQELISPLISGSATAGDVELGFASILYPNLPGIESRAIDWTDLDKRYQVPLTIYSSITAGAGGGWLGEELIQADSTLLKNNRDYAILGVETNTNTVGAVYLKGPDTGNVKVAAPGTCATNPYTADYFCQIAKQFQAPLIPVINSGNAPNTFIGVGCDENTPTVLVTLFLALLKDK